MKITSLILNFTEKCNSRCTTCSIWKISTPEALPVELVEKAFSSGVLSSVDTVYITGGEPLLGGYCREICTAISKYRPGILVRGETNSLQPEAYLDNILFIQNNLGFKTEFGLSLNGNAIVHDETRGIYGSFARVMDMAELLRMHGVPFLFAFVDCEETKDQLPTVQSIAALYGARVAVGNMRKSPRYNTDFAITNSRSGFDCMSSFSQLVIWPNGDVTACDEPGIPELTVCNLYEKDLLTEDLERVRLYVKSRACQPCHSAC